MQRVTSRWSHKSTIHLVPVVLLLGLYWIFQPRPLDVAPANDAESFKVVRVRDGDTFEVIYNGMRTAVRLIGIDTPERRMGSRLRRTAEQWDVNPQVLRSMGEEASKFVEALLHGTTVRLEYDVERYDRYDRLLAYAYLPDGRMLNALLLQEGYARVATYPPNVKYVDLFLQLQRESRQANRGFWVYN